MMKKLVSLLLILCLLLPAAALADTRATLNQRISTRSGPGTHYTEPGSFLKAGDVVTVRTRVWDDRNEIWWVQVEFSYKGEKIRAYTGSWRMNVNLNQVPIEQPLRSCTVIYDADAFAGPWYMGFMPWPDTIYAGTSATLYEVEDGYAHIECWNSRRQQMWRAWVPLYTLDCGYLYSSSDVTYPSNYGSSGSSYNGGYSGGSTSTGDDYSFVYGGATTSDQTFPIGEECRIQAVSGNARSGPGQEYELVTVVYRGDYYKIYDVQMASNGRNWYKIRVNGQYCWVSSGIVTIDGVMYY